jgi:hypothetical protein
VTCTPVYDPLAECNAETGSDVCSGAFVYNTDSATTGFNCRVIKGSLTIQGTPTTSPSETGLANLWPLTKVCGTVTIQNLDASTLEGLHNLELVTGSLTVQNNAFSAPVNEPDFITSLDGLRGLKYVGGGLAIQTNYHLVDLGGFVGPLVVPAAGAFVIQRQPQGAACCPGPCNGQVSTFSCCADTCPLVGLGGTGGFARVNYPCSDDKCKNNPYCEPPPGPQPCTGCFGGGSGVCQGLDTVCWGLVNGACPVGTTPC